MNKHGAGFGQPFRGTRITCWIKGDVDDGLTVKNNSTMAAFETCVNSLEAKLSKMKS
jgi:hypothetical protein